MAELKGWYRHELMYCSNVHPCSSVAELISQIELHVLPIMRTRKLTQMNLGLWLNRTVLQQLNSSSKLCSQWFALLSEHNLTIKSLNAFPQAEFHGVNVKTKVYFPEWSQQSRLDYTQLLVNFIAQHSAFFADEVSISTVPLGYKASWSQEKQKSAIKNLSLMANYLAAIKQKTGTHIRLCLEMEPDCQLESTDEMIEFFINDMQIASEANHAEHLGVCYDVCHQAVMFESITKSITAIEANGIVIGKVQISNALSFYIKDSMQMKTSLASYHNSPYLHQMKLKTLHGVVAFNDLDLNVLNKFSAQDQVRVHFHVPINVKSIADNLYTTQKEIIDVVQCLSSISSKPDIEVETYTWQLIAEKPEPTTLNKYLVCEIEWLEQELHKNHLIVNGYDK